MSTDLNDLSLVAAIAAHSTLAGAAQQLKLNHATVFRRLHNLEVKLGVRLFERQAGRYSATAAGEELAKLGLAINEQAASVLRQIAGQDMRPSGEVRIATTDSFANELIGPALRSCRQRYPDIRLQISSANQLFNLSKRDADIALRVASQPPDYLIGKRISRLAFAVYAASSDAPQARELAWPQLPWLALDDSISQHRSLRWLQQFVALEQVGLRSNSFVNLRQACSQGLGVALLPCFLADARADLQRISPVIDECASDLWLLMHPDLRQTARVKAVFEVLQQELLQQKDLLEGALG
jgi:DNA-binding transcriptional LysR family regulator